MLFVFFFFLVLIVVFVLDESNKIGVKMGREYCYVGSSYFMFLVFCFYYFYLVEFDVV